MRKVVQYDIVKDENHNLKTVFAYCDDGTIWELSTHLGEWLPVIIGTISQDEEVELDDN